LPVEHLHGILVAEVSGKSCSGFGVGGELLEMGFRVGRCKRCRLFAALVSGNVPIDDAVSFREHVYGVESSFREAFSSQVTDAYREKAREVSVRDAGGGTIPIYQSRVVDLIGEGWRAGGLVLAVDG
jgi:hypothetical protein